jgi:hypothetical protein
VQNQPDENVAQSSSGASAQHEKNWVVVGVEWKQRRETADRNRLGEGGESKRRNSLPGNFSRNLLGGVDA